MIGHKLSNNNENTTVAKSKKNHELNRPLAATDRDPAADTSSIKRGLPESEKPKEGGQS